MQLISKMMTAYALGENTTWPFFTFPQYEAIVGRAVNDTHAFFIGFTPLVNNADRSAFEAYVINDQSWIQIGLNLTASPENVTLQTPYISCPSGGDPYGRPQPCPTQDLYAPVRQVAPIGEYYPQLNLNAFSFDYFKRVFDGMVAAGEAILSEVINLGEPIHSEADWPASFMAAPVRSILGENGGDLVATLTAQIPWHSYFLKLIPAGIPGIIMVVKNTCNQVLTYEILGPDVDFLGVGDLHNPAFDKYQVTSDFTAFKSIAACRYSPAWFEKCQSH